MSWLNLPNMVSLGRLVSWPVLGWMIINEWYLPTFAILTVAGVNDWLDGFLARKMGINSIGSYLDPLADKVLIGSVVCAMMENDLLHPGLVGLVVARDVALAEGSRGLPALCVTVNETNDLKDDIATDDVKLELEAKPQMVQPLSDEGMKVEGYAMYRAGCKLKALEKVLRKLLQESASNIGDRVCEARNVREE
ncbi:hypothetical protein Droror1_Dr00024330 [Drosera rotundifolia]